MGTKQRSLFRETGKDDEVHVADDELTALDELFLKSRQYRTSHEYMELMNFVSRFPRYAPFNCMLLHLQNPNITYVASMADWAKLFNRRPRRKARPLVILQPFGPVMFLYDLDDTEGEDVPEALLKPFGTEGAVPKAVFARTCYNCMHHQIEVRDDPQGRFNAGMSIRLTPKAHTEYKDLNLNESTQYLVLLNGKHSLEEKYTTLAHELAHVFCGHLGVDKLAWWERRQRLSAEMIEIEAESVAYLVCRRRGLKSASERYLSRYQTDANTPLPFFGLNAVFQACDYIEKMGDSEWKKLPRKPKSEYAGSSG